LNGNSVIQIVSEETESSETPGILLSLPLLLRDASAKKITSEEMGKPKEKFVYELTFVTILDELTTARIFAQVKDHRITVEMKERNGEIEQ